MMTVHNTGSLGQQYSQRAYFSVAANISFACASRFARVFACDVISSRDKVQRARCNLLALAYIARVWYQSFKTQRRTYR
jgi:hypothetical protein